MGGRKGVDPMGGSKGVDGTGTLPDCDEQVETLEPTL